MKRSMYGKVTLVTFLILIAQIAFTQVREKREASNFTELSESDTFVIEWSMGGTESLEIKVNEQYINDVISQARGGKLIIGLEENRNMCRMKESPRA